MIVEDELIAATDIQEQLEDAGYEVTGIARSYEEALALFQETSPDLVLLDIQLDGDKDGIEVARKLNKLSLVPIVYITGNAEDETMRRARKTRAVSFVQKPFRARAFMTSLDLIVENVAKKRNGADTVLKDAIFLPSYKQGHEKVLKKEIRYIEGDRSYVRIFTGDGTYDITTNLATLLPQLDSRDFLRVSKKYIINVQHLSKINKDEVTVHGKCITIGEHYRKELLNSLNFVRTKL